MHPFLVRFFSQGSAICMISALQILFLGPISKTCIICRHFKVHNYLNLATNKWHFSTRIFLNGWIKPQKLFTVSNFFQPVINLAGILIAIFKQLTKK